MGFFEGIIWGNIGFGVEGLGFWVRGPGLRDC